MLLVDHDFVHATEADLDNLGPGCFVCVNDGMNRIWVEIKEIFEHCFVGRVHTQLSEEATPYQDLQFVTFEKNQVILLGCDRYCFC